MGTVGAPTAALQDGSVQVAWSPPGGDHAVTGYRVRRYGAGGAGVDAGPACAGLVTATTCIEADVPEGTWRYAVTPELHGWTGVEGPLGEPVEVTPADPAPTVTSVALVKSLGGTAGWIRSGGGFHVYAALDGGTGPVSVRADLSAFAAGTSVALTTAGGPWVVDGVTYGWRTAEVVAGAALPDAATTYAVTAIDGLGRTSSASSTATVDDVAPAPYDVTTTDAARPGTMDVGDRITYTFTEVIDAASVMTGWSGTEIDAVVRVTDGGTGADSLTVWDDANAFQLRLGTLTLGRSDYVTATMTFGASGTRARVRLSGTTVVVVLGSPSASGSVVVGSTGTGTMRWTPRSGLWDRAGNACPTTGINERGSLDREF